MPRIESLLAARLFVAPQLVGDRLFFLSNMSGRLSLYAMDQHGSVPEPLLPPHIALQNPELIGGYTFTVFPDLGQILVMIDHDGDENYQPMLIPIEGGFPEPAFGEDLRDYRSHLVSCDLTANMVYLGSESRHEVLNVAFQCELRSRRVTRIAISRWGAWVTSYNPGHTRALLVEGYTAGDTVLYLWEQGHDGWRPLAGIPLDARQPDDQPPLTSFGMAEFTSGERGVLLSTSLFSDSYGLAYLPLAQPEDLQPVTITGAVHGGVGELDAFEHLHADRYLVGYNIDGCSWRYEGRFDEDARTLVLDQVICGRGTLANGVLEALRYDEGSDRYALSFATATMPTQIAVIGANRQRVDQPTAERVLGIDPSLLAPGEDASYLSHDGTRVSARLYLPAPSLGFSGPRPLVYYVHGGPQGQERPNFAWFSMPLIQFLTLNGFAVFVPNVRGSTGYGLHYMKQVDHDWGGQDRLDHVHAMGLLRQDPRLDTSRASVVGRSYGGYMTLTLAARHPDLWSAAVDMFGPYDLLKFMESIPPTWKPYFALAVGDPDRDRAFLIERSPATYMDAIACPLLVIQGQNDPRVVEAESRAVVERLRAQGKQVEYLLFDDEGHDILKFENRVTCYNAITDFFRQHLQP